MNMYAYKETAGLDGDGVVSAWYVHGLNIDEPLARIDNSTGAVHYYHADILGSVIALTNSSGGVSTQYNYSPFGVTQVIGEDISQPFRFTAREYDPETGLYYYRARYYSPEMGRFVSEDPIGLAGGDVNFYRYVGNNPVNFVDPMGLEDLEVEEILDAKTREKPYVCGVKHFNKNKLNNMNCPATDPCKIDFCGDDEPERGKPCSDEWIYEGRPKYHCYLRTYRGRGSKRGWQCTYKENGDLSTTKECMGTYDEYPPFEDDGSVDLSNLPGHTFVDWFPFKKCGN